MFGYTKPSILSLILFHSTYFWRQYYIILSAKQVIYSWLVKRTKMHGRKTEKWKHLKNETTSSLDMNILFPDKEIKIQMPEFLQYYQKELRTMNKNWPKKTVFVRIKIIFTSVDLKKRFKLKACTKSACWCYLYQKKKKIQYLIQPYSGRETSTRSWKFLKVQA